MTVRFRLMCDGKTSEYAFDRSRIAVGRGPFNDLVISSKGVAPRHGALTHDPQEGLRFKVDACGQPSAVVRDGETLEEISGEQSTTVTLEVGDLVILGHQARFEVLAISKEEPEAWSLHDLGDGTTHAPPSPKVTERYLSASERLAAQPGELRVLLAQVASLCEDAMRVEVVRAVVTIFTDANEFLDDTFALDFGEDPDADIYDIARDPLSRFGATEATRVREALADGAHFMRAPGERDPEGTSLYLGITSGEQAQGMLGVETAEAIDIDEELTAVMRALASLASLCVSVRHATTRARSLDEENRFFRERARRHYLFKELIYESEAMRRVYHILNEMVPTSHPVMITGEAGSGKELLARALHHLGPRRDGMFISVSCGRLSEEVIGVELFGCAASELAGAVAARKGIFELAQKGTVYLDEIDRLSAALQAKVVRMLKEGEVRRVGDSVGRRIRSRLIASTHRDMRALVTSGELRHDLYLLLKEHLLAVPPLRERDEDLMPLAEIFLRMFAQRYARALTGFSPEVAERLAEHDWPGNVRELQSFIEAAVLNSPPEETSLKVESLVI